MKKRYCFVSNSSSSSFIAYIGLIEDEKRFSEFEKRTGFQYNRLTYNQLKEEYHYGDFYGVLSMPDTKYIDNTFIHVYENKDAIEEEGEYFEDEDLEFSDKTLNIFSATTSDGIRNLETADYTGRNG